ncbi:hypothetical protein L2E82_49381 [Cichorium intybus]|uniref:Uncharacterized protein n=1 Tax=Cichorium intybus TaxID=13427 RepID=A0ACB8YZI6_CICIN|nr:hypothetical protein L2E82_49381 [Cichorium intybus]
MSNPQHPTRILEMDLYSSLPFDSDYYHNLYQHKGLFLSDATLLANPQSTHKTQVLQNPKVFVALFAWSMHFLVLLVCYPEEL